MPYHNSNLPELQWDPICTPFTKLELERLAFTSEREVPIDWKPTVPPAWVHPEDPMHRIRLYNFWDILEQTLQIALYHFTTSSEDISGISTEFVASIAHEFSNLGHEYDSLQLFLSQSNIGQALNSSFGYAASSLPILGPLQNELVPGDGVPTIEVSALLLMETGALIERIETLLRSQRSISIDLLE